MIQPEELKQTGPLVWSTGTGTEVWELFCACEGGDFAAVQRLIANNPALVRCQHAYRKPLYFAVRENRLDIAAFLLERDPDPIGLAVIDSLLEIARDRGYSEMEQLLETKLAGVHGASAQGEAIAAAIRDRNTAQMRQMLDAQPELLHAGDLRGNQPIHWAVMTRQLEFIDELLARGADVEACRTDGARPIQLVNGDYHYRGWRDVPQEITTTPAEVLTHLRTRGAYCDINTAASIGDIDRVRELLDHDPGLANRVSEYVTYYIGSGAPLKNAAARGHLEVVKLLLERGADPSPAVESSADALSRAISNSDQRMIELLCSYGSTRSVDILAYYGDVQTAAAVFAANPALADDVEAFSNAASEGQEAFIRLMLRYQPDLPRKIAVAAKTPELTQLLFAHGMNASQPNWLGITQLHEFARKGDVESAKLFLDHGADLHARDEDICSTPLGWAAKYGHLPMAELLLVRGAKPNLPDDPSWATPLAWATRRGHANIAEILKRHGAR